MIILALDPSLTSTGFAVVDVFDRDRWGRRLAAWGTVTTESDSTTSERLVALAQCVASLIAEYRPVHVAIEFPAVRGLPPQAQGFAGTPLTITQYAMAVGVAFLQCNMPWTDPDTRLVVSPPRVRSYPVDEWSKGRGIPGTRKDPYKEKRTQYAALVWGMDPEQFGPKSRAKDIADAALLGWVAVSDLEMGQIRERERAAEGFKLE